eukprot:3943_1
MALNWNPPETYKTLWLLNKQNQDKWTQMIKTHATYTLKNKSNIRCESFGPDKNVKLASKSQSGRICSENFTNIGYAFCVQQPPLPPPLEPSSPSPSNHALDHTPDHTPPTPYICCSLESLWHTPMYTLFRLNLIDEFMNHRYPNTQKICVGSSLWLLKSKITHIAAQLLVIEQV